MPITNPNQHTIACLFVGKVLGINREGQGWTYHMGIQEVAGVPTPPSSV